MLLILYICLKFVVNRMHKTMERMCLSSLLSSFWQPYYFVVAIDIFDRHIFFYRHIVRQIWRTSSDAYGLSNHWICNAWLIETLEDICTSNLVEISGGYDKESFNSLRPRQNGSRFADDIFKCIFLNENVRISIKIHWSLFPRVQLILSQHWFR